MSATGKPEDDKCPRCGEPFHCGAAEARCDCFDLQLTAAQRQSLAAQYSGCLCMACLKALQAAKPAVFKR